MASKATGNPQTDRRSPSPGPPRPKKAQARATISPKGERTRDMSASRLRPLDTDISQVLGEEFPGKGESVVDQAFRRACHHHVTT